MKAEFFAECFGLGFGLDFLLFFRFRLISLTKFKSEGLVQKVTSFSIALLA